MSISWDRAYARDKARERETTRRINNDPVLQAQSRRRMERFSAACKQTRGNLKAAYLLIEEWEEAEEREHNSPVRTLVLVENGDPEGFTHEDDLS